MAKTAADWISELKTSTKQAFPNIKRGDVEMGLQERLKDPKKIHQRNTSLCGCASLFYCLATSKPDLYAQYVVELYLNGKSTIGSLTVEPGEDCRKYGATRTSGIDPADWVALASLRDSENDAFDYQSPSNEAGGITMPGDLLDWFKDVGFGKDTNDTNLVFTKGIGTLRDANKKFGLKQNVCLFISAKLLNDPTNDTMTADHWVVLQAPVTETGGKVSTEVYTWGSLRTIDLPASTFCKNFYGYISAS